MGDLAGMMVSPYNKLSLSLCGLGCRNYLLLGVVFSYGIAIIRLLPFWFPEE